jgi:hypothetical protein
MKSPKPYFSLVLAILVQGVCLASVRGDEMRTWTSTDGRELKGEFVSVDQTGVRVRTENFKIVKIPGELLSGEDAVYVTKLHAEREAEKKREEEAAEAEAKKAKFLAGPLTYVLSEGWEDWPSDRHERIVGAMDAAVGFFNEFGDFEKEVRASNVPGVPTADANYGGHIRWGGSISRRVALHEISHTLGIGNHPQWGSFVEDGKWTGKHGIAQLKEFDGKDAVLYADRQHFWPYGLNYDKGSSEENDLRFIKMVEAFRKDLGID